MKIAGLQKTSLIDYPKHIVSIIFTQGCNFRCPYCHNPSLIPVKNKDEDYLPLDYLYNFLLKRKGLIDGVSITGGEPTMQSDLIDLIKKIKSIDLKVKLDTNGTNPQVVKNLLNNKLLDYIAMDVKAPLAKYDLVACPGNLTKQIKETIELIKKAGIDYEFRTTVVPTLHTTKDILEIGKLINGATHYYLQNFRPQNTLDLNLRKISSFPPKQLEEFKKVISPYVQSVTIRN